MPIFAGFLHKSWGCSQHTGTSICKLSVYINFNNEVTQLQINCSYYFVSYPENGWMTDLLGADGGHDFGAHIY